MAFFSIRRYLVSILAIIVLSAGLTLISFDSASAKAQGRVIAVTGVSSVDGEQVIVRVLAEVTAGRSDNEVAAAALNAVNARKLTKSEYALLGNPWDQFSDSNPDNNFVVQRYNDKNEATGGFGAIVASRLTWNDANSPFHFQEQMESTGKCPSLVKECKGRQAFDGKNDIGWVALQSSSTLAVTWSGTVSDEADVAFNTNFTWNTNGANYDIETVALHEFGHVAGLGHSLVDGSIMEAVYDGARRTLTDDDVEGLQAMYGSGGGSTPTPTPDPGSTPTPVPTATPVPTGELYAGFAGYGDGVSYVLGGRRNRDLTITIDVTDGANSVSGAYVSISVFKNGSLYGTGGPSATGSGGTVSWQIRNVKSGTWSTTVETITKGSLSCVAECPDSSSDAWTK